MNAPVERSASEMPNVALCFHRALRSSASKLRRIYDAELATCGLRAHEFGLLSVIQATGPIAIVDLADKFLFDRATLRYKLVPLERAGLIEYVVDPRDRRSRRINATPAGIAKLTEAKGPWDRVQARVEGLLGSDEAATLRTTDGRHDHPRPVCDATAGLIAALADRASTDPKTKCKCGESFVLWGWPAFHLLDRRPGPPRSSNAGRPTSL